MNSAFQDLIDFFDTTFFTTVTVTETKSGYTSERVSSGNYQYTAFQLPYSDTTTIQQRELNIPACLGAAVVLITFLTLVRTFFRFVFGR